jgi:hypothetical protein
MCSASDVRSRRRCSVSTGEIVVNIGAAAQAVNGYARENLGSQHATA